MNHASEDEKAALITIIVSIFGMILLAIAVIVFAFCLFKRLERQLESRDNTLMEDESSGKNTVESRVLLFEESQIPKISFEDHMKIGTVCFYNKKG